jgi:hypothetical protein
MKGICTNLSNNDFALVHKGDQIGALANHATLANMFVCLSLYGRTYSIRSGLAMPRF